MICLIIYHVINNLSSHPSVPTGSNPSITSLYFHQYDMVSCETEINKNAWKKRNEEYLHLTIYHVISQSTISHFSFIENPKSIIFTISYFMNERWIRWEMVKWWDSKNEMIISHPSHHQPSHIFKIQKPHLLSFQVRYFQVLDQDEWENVMWDVRYHLFSWFLIW